MKKELKIEFKKTKYGAKISKQSFIANILFVISIIAEIIYYLLVQNFDFRFEIIDLITGLLFIEVIYYSAKKSGAMEQFKASKEI